MSIATGGGGGERQFVCGATDGQYHYCVVYGADAALAAGLRVSLCVTAAECITMASVVARPGGLMYRS